MKRWIQSVMLMTTLVLSPFFASASEKTPLVLGVFPYVTPVQLAQFHTPLKDYLSRSLSRPVTLVTAPDFMSFVDRTREGQYDMVLTAPHLGRLAQVRDGYLPVVQTSHTVQGFFLVRKDSGINKIADLKGKTVMMAQKVSIVYQMAEQTLRENGLVPGESVTIIETRTHNNAIHAPLRGEADASVTGKLLWHVLPEDQKVQLKLIGTTAETPGFLFMAHSRLAKQDIESIKTTLLEFHLKPGSESYFTTNGFDKFQAVDEKGMKALDPYTRIFLKPISP